MPDVVTQKPFRHRGPRRLAFVVTPSPCLRDCRAGGYYYTFQGAGVGQAHLPSLPPRVGVSVASLPRRVTRLTTLSTKISFGRIETLADLSQLSTEKTVKLHATSLAGIRATFERTIYLVTAAYRCCIIIKPSTVSLCKETISA